MFSSVRLADFPRTDASITGRGLVRCVTSAHIAGGEAPLIKNSSQPGNNIEHSAIRLLL